MKKRWKENESNQELEKRTNEISQKFKIGTLVSSILASKKLNDKEIEIFLKPTRENFYNPFLMPDMKKAINRIEEAIKNNEKIIIYGDYDADGITSTTIIKRFLKDRGIDTQVYIPNRLDEGYGLNEDAIRLISSEKAKLIITVDCGITAIKEVKLAKELGIDVVITDHHEPGEELPEAIAVVDCKRKDNQYPFNQLAGCGVAFKLIQALAQRMDLNANEALKYLDIACVGTISDIVPLVDENRVIAKLGLMLVSKTKNIGLKELLNVSGYKIIDSSAISFGISPRINASGRMGHQEDALELFLTDDPIKARKLAQNIENYNRARQETEKRIYQEASQLIEEETKEFNLKLGNKEEKVENNKINQKDYPKSAIVLGKENWHHGVIGIVSSKITEYYYKPSILICFEGENGKGSGRSINEFDLHKAITECKQYLTNFGGHSMAIGLSLKTEDFPKFKEEFEQYAEKNIPKDMLVPILKIDEEINEKDVNISNIKELKLLEPFGESNIEPIIIYKNLKIEAIRTLSEGKHLKLNLKGENTYIESIGFNLGELAENYQIGDRVDIVGNIGINTFNNKEKIQVILKDLRKSIG